MTLGEAIKEYRNKHDLSMRAFGRLAGLSVTYISNLENNVTQRGNKPIPSLETYKAIAKAMGIELDELLRVVDDDVRIGKEAPPTGEKQKQLAALVPHLDEDIAGLLLAQAEAMMKMKEGK